MDPSSDYSLHSFQHQHHHGQRHQRLGAQQTLAACLHSRAHTHKDNRHPNPQLPISNPFVRSHHGRCANTTSRPPIRTAQRLPHLTSAVFLVKELNQTSQLALKDLVQATSSASLSAGDVIPVSIKCPSLDRDSAIVRIRAMTPSQRSNTRLNTHGMALLELRVCAASDQVAFYRIPRSSMILSKGVS